MFKWDFSESEETLSLRSPGETLENLEDGGLQLALSFNEEGSILATGSEVDKIICSYFFQHEYFTNRNLNFSENVHEKLKAIDYLIFDVCWVTAFSHLICFSSQYETYFHQYDLLNILL